ncbi:hypothetical protein BsWGS_26698 [Bradybaena similaris]
MSATFPYSFQPQPPLHPKTTGRKQRPSAQLVTSSDEDTGSDSDYTPLTVVRLSVHGIASSKAKIKSNITPVSSFSNSCKSGIAKNPGLETLHNSQTLTTNNCSAVNSKHVLDSINLNNETANEQIPSSHSIQEDSRFTCHAGENTLQSLTVNNQLNSTINNDLNSTDSCVSSTSQSTCDQLNNSNKINVDTPANTTSSEKVGIVSACDTTTKSSTNRIDDSFIALSNFAYEHDHDYESVSSPCSSTSSGPIYVRPPGFTHHAQEVEVTNVKNKLKKKKYSTPLATVREGCKKREATPPKLKPRREPLPMKLRALPQSFWEQPNVAHQVSPATLFLPPLLNKDSEEVLMDVRPVTPPEERDVTNRPHEPERTVIVTNTDLLFKLFDGIGEGKKVTKSVKYRSLRVRKPITKTNTKGMLLGNDPCMVDAVTENIFPQLSIESSRHCSVGGNTSLQLITLKEGDRTVTLPSLNLEQNYPQMLSELVLHI